MATRKRKTTKMKIERSAPIELAKEVKTSVIAVSRDIKLDVDFADPKQLDELYATVPEVSRAVDLRGAAIISRGFEITPRKETDEAKQYANLCLKILNDSGGVSFLEQWQKNADLYGNGYVEMVNTEGDDISRLAHVHPYQFGYELEVVTNQATLQKENKIKLDEDTQLPTGYAQYTYNETDEVWENLKVIEKERIAHLRYKVIGDALYGISIVDPMRGSIIRKLLMEDHMEAAGRLVAAPKIVISGKFPTEEDARAEAREAANLDVNDVVILDSDEDKTFQIVNPGQTNLPQLREIFVVNITAASGVPRPILTSESSEINKATMSELMRHLRENLRSNMNKIKNVLEMKVFKRIGEVYGITDYENIVPIFTFPEDPDTEDDIIVREERKAATLTSLSNSLQIFANMMTQLGSDVDIGESLKTSMGKTFEIYDKTIDTFLVNNDQNLGEVEETLKDPEPVQLAAFIDDVPTQIQTEESFEEIGMGEPVSLIDDIEQIKRPEILRIRHNTMHQLYEDVRGGAEIIDIETGEIITLPKIIKKHAFYIHQMEQLGMVHEPHEIAPELDEIVGYDY